MIIDIVCLRLPLFPYGEWVCVCVQEWWWVVRVLRDYVYVCVCMCMWACVSVFAYVFYIYANLYSSVRMLL